MIKGNVINALELVLSQINIPIKLFTCGPHGMMRAIFNFSKKFNYDCSLALETIMACGIGICQGCTVVKECPDHSHSYRNKYALACFDGPVFDAKEISNAF